MTPGNESMQERSKLVGDRVASLFSPVAIAEEPPPVMVVIDHAVQGVRTARPGPSRWRGKMPPC